MWKNPHRILLGYSIMLTIVNKFFTRMIFFLPGSGLTPPMVQVLGIMGKIS